MNLRQLRYFVVLSEALNFHRAAERLHISQPPLTVTIRKLEEELGAALFARSSRGLSLTPAGEDALPLARMVLFQVEQMRQAVRARTDAERGRLTIGFSDATAPVLRRLLPAFRRRHPRVELVLSEHSPSDLVRRLRLRQLDISLLRLPLDNPVHIETTAIATDQLVVAVPEVHPLARHQAIPLSALRDEPLVCTESGDPLRALLEAACARAGFAPRIAQGVATSATMLKLAQMGLGLALVPADAWSDTEGLRLVRLSDPVEFEIGLATPRDSANRLAAAWQAVAEAELGLPSRADP
ncbi:LysR substrate-binding domain-containing protein [Novosphingobium bradum]|uniref:LysR substrate-binding domain-containing protein n=1 Tax=Novosphingobium bradum TaxID=1737444 RepID=A0ABV7IJB2_9SPHN